MQKGFTSLLILLITIPIIVAIAAYFYRNTSSISTTTSPIKTYEKAQENISNINQKVNGFTAKFEIYTLGTKRVFTSLMYHNLSSDVYISEPDPSIIHVKESGVTWDDFFKTLPFSLTKECLVTGDKQTFCTNKNQILKFILNGIEDPDALDKEIKEGDILRVEVTAI